MAFQQLSDRSDRQDRRLDNPGERLGVLEKKDASRDTELAQIRESLRGIQSDLRKALWALAVFGVTSLILERLG